MLDVHIIDDVDGGIDRKVYQRLKEKLSADPTANLVSHKASDDCVFVFTNHHGFLDTIRQRVNASHVYCIGASPIFSHTTLAECIKTVSTLLQVQDKREEITTTNVRDFKLDQLKAVIRMLGGFYTSKLSPKETTVLVESTPLRPSQKHNAACAIPGLSIVTPDWLYNSLYEGKLEKKDAWPLPIFEEKTICCTGFQKEERINIELLVKKFGGTFEKKLSTAVDFLIAGSPNGTKYEYAKENKIKICTHQWLERCVKDLWLHQPSRFPFKQKKPKASKPAEDPLDLQDDIPAPKIDDIQVFGEIEATVDVDWQRCKGPVIHDPDNDCFLEDCLISLVNLEPERVHDRAVKLILAGGGTRLSYFHPDAMYIVTTNPRKAKSACKERIPGSKIVNMGWLEACYRTKSFVPCKEFELEEGKKRRSSFWSTKNDSAEEPVDFTNFYQNIPKDKRPDGIFVNLTFQIRNLPFAEKDHCSKMIKENGGTIVEAQTPHYVVATDLKGREGEICKRHAVSPQWIDACISEGKLYPLGVDFEHFPKYRVNSRTCSGFADFTIVVGGFKPKQKHAVEKLVDKIGGTVEKSITPTENLILICPFLQKELRTSKYSDALKLEVPVVNIMWLMDSILRGAVRKPGNYIFSEKSFHVEEPKEKESELGLEFSKSLNAQLRSLQIEEKMNMGESEPAIPASFSFQRPPPEKEKPPELGLQFQRPPLEKLSPAKPKKPHSSPPTLPFARPKKSPDHILPKPSEKKSLLEDLPEEMPSPVQNKKNVDPESSPIPEDSPFSDAYKEQAIQKESESVSNIFEDVESDEEGAVQEPHETTVISEDLMASQSQAKGKESEAINEGKGSNSDRGHVLTPPTLDQPKEMEKRHPGSGSKKKHDRRSKSLMAATKGNSSRKKKQRIRPCEDIDMDQIHDYHFWIASKIAKKLNKLKFLVGKAGGHCTKRSTDKKVTHFVYLEGDLDGTTSSIVKAKKRYEEGSLKFIHAKKLNKILIERLKKDRHPEEPLNRISTNPTHQSAIVKKFTSATEPQNLLFPGSQDPTRRRSDVNYSKSKKRKSSDTDTSKQDSPSKKAKVSRRRKMSDCEEPKRKRQKVAEEKKPTFYVSYSAVDDRESVQEQIKDLGWELFPEQIWKDLESDYLSPHLDHPKITHLVVGNIMQTVKIYVAIAVGAKIVTPEWLQQCYQARKYIPEDDYLWENKSASEDVQEILDYIPKFRERQLNSGMFWGKKVFLHSGVSQEMKQCRQILVALGAYVTITSKPERKYDIYLLENPDQDDMAEEEFEKQMQFTERMLNEIGNEGAVFDVEICMDYFTLSEAEVMQQNNFCSVFYDSMTPSQSQPLTE